MDKILLRQLKAKRRGIQKELAEHQQKIKTLQHELGILEKQIAQASIKLLTRPLCAYCEEQIQDDEEAVESTANRPLEWNFSNSEGIYHIYHKTCYAKMKHLMMTDPDTKPTYG